MTQTSPSQTLHIFAKDARRFWPEIVISIALLAAFAYVQPLANQGQAHQFGTNVLYSILRPILYGLIPISWWVLVSRVVHEENLVGDRQFWITRPYRWPSLLAAKLLFLAAFVLIPVGLMQAILLSESGFHPIHLLPAMFFGVALLGIEVILPLVALSTITSSFARLTVTMLGIFISVLICIALLVPRARNFGLTPHAEWPYLVITFAACAAIVLLQYARRRTLIARVILGATIVLLIVLPIFFSTSLMALFFPAGAATSAGTFGISRSQTKSPWLAGMANDPSAETLTIYLPVDISGVAPDSRVDIEAIKVNATTSSGLTYAGPWRSQGTNPHQPGSNESLPVVLPKSFLDQAKAGPITISLSLGVAQLTSQGTSSMPLPTGKTEVPGIGICTGDRNFLNPDMGYSVSCTSALRAPDYTHLTARWSDVPCNRPQPPLDQLIAGDSYIGSFDSDPAGMGLSALVTQQVGFSNGYVALPNNASRPRYLCAGTPLTFTRYLLTRRFGITLIVPSLNLTALPSTPFGDHTPQSPAPNPNE